MTRDSRARPAAAATAASAAASTTPVPAPAPAPAPALAFSGVSLTLRRPGAAPLRLVDDVHLTLGRGERLALVGESGSGKSVLARAVLGLDRDIEVSGEIRVGELSLAGPPASRHRERQLRTVRGRRVAMVFQNPMGALDPLMTVGAQLTEPMRYRGVTGRAARAAAVALLSDLGIADAARRVRAYPHEFSGGMRQRVALAMALAAEPEILLADEPTTALDVRAQEQVMTLIDGVTRDRGLSVLLISHDLALVAGFADRVAVMYAGRIVHDDPVDAAFADPAHPYTRGLLGAIPRVDRRPPRLPAIEGAMPSPGRRPSGCAFHPRCGSRLHHCADEQPRAVPTAAGGAVACHLFGPAAPPALSTGTDTTSTGATTTDTTASTGMGTTKDTTNTNSTTNTVTTDTVTTDTDTTDTDTDTDTTDTDTDTDTTDTVTTDTVTTNTTNTDTTTDTVANFGTTGGER